MFLTVKLCTELFEIELFISIKMDLALDNLQRLISHETQTNKKILAYSQINKNIHNGRKIIN